MSCRRELGRRGERLAARHLRQQGYRILARNLVVGRSEADLVAVAPDGVTVVVVEVKTRRSDHVPPEWSVGREKQRRLAWMAETIVSEGRFSHLLPRNVPGGGPRVRVDVVAIHWPPERRRPTDVRHYVDAFESPFE